MGTLKLIQGFLNHTRFAFVGVSRNPNHFSRKLFREFVGRGYEVLPVNPHARELEGRLCFDAVQSITPPVPAALIMAPFLFLKDVVEDGAEAGISLVRIYSMTGPSRSHQGIADICQQRGINLIDAYCPYMVFETTSIVRRIHGVTARILGQYPQQ